MTRILTIGLLLAGFGMMANAADSLAERQVAQRARIRQGVQSGVLTQTEAARLRANERQLHRQVVRNRIDGGQLTPAERARLQARANKNSRNIARLKNNNRNR